MLPYRDLIHSCAKDRKDSHENLITMVRWKDTREPFSHEHVSTTASSSSKTTEELDYLDEMYGEWSGEDDNLELMEVDTPDDNTDTETSASNDTFSIKSED